MKKYTLIYRVLKSNVKLIMAQHFHSSTLLLSAQCFCGTLLCAVVIPVGSPRHPPVVFIQPLLSHRANEPNTSSIPAMDSLSWPGAKLSPCSHKTQHKKTQNRTSDSQIQIYTIKKH